MGGIVGVRKRGIFVIVVLVVMKGMHWMNDNETEIMMADRDALEEHRYLLMTT